MGTRGAWGFVLDGTEYLTYNHYDSYPDALGLDLLAWARTQNWEEIRQQVKNLTLVDEHAEFTTEDAIKVGLEPQNVSTGTDWYSLLRSVQGDPGKTLEVGYMIDSHTFPLDSLFCEWAYVIDLDDEHFEVYQGFQKTLPEAGRWAGRPTKEEDSENYGAHVAWADQQGRDPWMPEVSEYKAVALRERYRLDNLPTEEQFIERFVGDPE